jgi:hypothetical protein
MQAQQEVPVFCMRLQTLARRSKLKVRSAIVLPYVVSVAGVSEMDHQEEAPVVG